MRKRWTGPMGMPFPAVPPARRWGWERHGPSAIWSAVSGAVWSSNDSGLPNWQSIRSGTVANAGGDWCVRNAQKMVKRTVKRTVLKCRHFNQNLLFSRDYKLRHAVGRWRSSAWVWAECGKQVNECRVIPGTHFSYILKKLGRSEGRTQDRVAAEKVCHKTGWQKIK